MFAHFTKKSAVLFSLILIIGSVFRLYNLRGTLQFLGDQGRDAVIARGILIEHDPAFIGPVTSVGNMYLGPFYYYFMVLPLMFSYPDPIGPAYAVALFGIVTLALVYYLGREMLGERIAFVSMALYAISPLVIENVRFSWNPNIVPFFSLLLVWFVWKTMQGKFTHWLWVGLCTAILIQLHYLTLVIVGAGGLVWFWQLATQIKRRHIHPEFIRATLGALIIVLVSFTPLMLFDYKHEWTNLRSFLSFFTGVSATGEAESHFRGVLQVSAIFYAWVGLAMRTMFEIFGVKIPTAASMAAFLLFVYMSIKTLYFHATKDIHLGAKKMIFFFFCVCIFVLALYTQSIFTHYLGMVFPLSVFLLAIFLDRLWQMIFLRPLAVGLILLLGFQSLRQYPGQHTLGMNIDVFAQTATEIAARTRDGQSYDILLLSENNDFLGMNYRYFLLNSANKPATEQQVHEFSRLFVIDEQRRENPLDTPQYKIAIWPNRDIVESFSIPNGPNVYVLDR